MTTKLYPSMFSSGLLVECAPHELIAEASEIDLLPGQWPEKIEAFAIGNGMPFLRSTKMLSPDGELVYVRYNQANGCMSLRVFND
jgi:hypothetical protein